jgi:hypothetical protein
MAAAWLPTVSWTADIADSAPELLNPTLPTVVSTPPALLDKKLAETILLRPHYQSLPA